MLKIPEFSVTSQMISAMFKEVTHNPFFQDFARPSLKRLMISEWNLARTGYKFKTKFQVVKTYANRLLVIDDSMNHPAVLMKGKTC